MLAVNKEGEISNLKKTSKKNCEKSRGQKQNLHILFQKKSNLLMPYERYYCRGDGSFQIGGVHLLRHYLKKLRHCVADPQKLEGMCPQAPQAPCSATPVQLTI